MVAVDSNTLRPRLLGFSYCNARRGTYPRTGEAARNGEARPRCFSQPTWQIRCRIVYDRDLLMRRIFFEEIKKTGI